MFHRDEALSLMEGRGRILETASEISSWFRESGLSVAVIGGIAVVLHGHWRTTRGINLLVSSPIQEVAALLESHGFHLDPTRREFISDGILVHLADVIGMIRHHKLTTEFARSIDKTLRPAFRKLVRSIERET
jgi:hypothetical protein